MTHMFDLTGEGSVFAKSFPDALQLTHREEPPDWGVRVGHADSYDAPIVIELVNVRRDTSMSALPLLRPFLDEPRSLDEMIGLFRNAQQRSGLTKFGTLEQQLSVWKPMLADMAYARQGPDLERRHSLIIHDLSRLPLDFARRWFSVWVHRQYQRSLTDGPQRGLRKALFILQADAMFGREYVENTGSETLSLSKRTIALQRFGWAIIILSHQPSELDRALRNACAIPIAMS